MYFVTMNRRGYVLFSMTPSERAAVGITEAHMVQLLVRAAGSDDWTVLHQWKMSDYSATEFMAALHDAVEPADPRELLARLPAHLRP